MVLRSYSLTINRDIIPNHSINRPSIPQIQRCPIPEEAQTVQSRNTTQKIDKKEKNIQSSK